MNDQNINEFFALPMGLEEVANIYGIKLYGSNALKNKLIESIYHSDYISFFSKKISNMIMRDEIIPGFLSSNIFSYFFNHLMGFGNNGILAFYDYISDKIYILIENTTTLAMISDVNLGRYILHELVHLSFHRKPKTVFNLSYNILKKYYFEYFKMILQLKEEPPNFRSFIKFLFFEMEMAKQPSINQLNKYLKYLLSFKDYSQLKYEDLKNIANKLILIIVYKNKGVAILDIIRSSKEMILPLHKAYYNAFNKNADISVFQEIFAPSEVISMYSELYPHDKVIKTIINYI